MEELIKECPKAWEGYKNHLFDKYKDNERLRAFITDETLLLNVESAPMSATTYFDKIGYIGTYDYDFEDKAFYIKMNGELIDVHEDHQYSEDRKEAEQILIKYLFHEVEKTL